MKKTIKPFDLEAAKKGAKVETRDGKLGGYFDGDELRNVLGWLDEHNFEY